MDYHHLDEFKAEIEAIESFFTEFAAREDEILTLGMKRVAAWKSYSTAEKAMPNFESRIHEFLVFLRPIDKPLFIRAQQVAVDSKLVESISGMQVVLSIAAQRQRLGVGSEIFSNLFFHMPYISNFISKRRLFSEEIIPIQQLLIALGRLKNIVTVAKDLYIKQWRHDSDVFKPSNLDNEKIITLIETAIEAVENKTRATKDDKKQLIEYLVKAKHEFSEENPSWNKIVGALVIAPAIISGIADADDALGNIDAAIKYILGVSIEHRIPSSVPLLKEQNSHENKPIEIIQA